MTHSPYYKVLWQEGMLVGPQHFQQWDHYQEAMLELRVRYLHPYSWGVIGMELNPNLFNDCRIIELTAFRGVFPSGTVIDIPSGDTAPEAREATAQMFSGGTAQTVGVYLALPLEAAPRPNNCCPPTSSIDRLGNRYTPSCVIVADENSGQNELEIATARKNLRILFGNEPSAGYERLKIGELGVQDGAIVLNDAYIPPSLILAASPYLQSMIEILSQALLRRVDLVGRTVQPTDLDTYFWLLSQVGGLLAILKHFLAVKTIHPEVLYRSLIQFAGQLNMFSIPSGFLELTPYDHENLAATFGQVEKVLYRSLEVMDAYIQQRRQPTIPKGA